MSWWNVCFAVIASAALVRSSALPAIAAPQPQVQPPVAQQQQQQQEPAASPAVATPDVGTGRGLGQHSRNSIQTGDSLMDAIYNDCLRKDSVSCVKYKLFSFVDKVLASKDSFSLTEGVTVVKSPGVGDGGPRALDQEAADSQSTDVESMLVSRVDRFLRTHTLKIDLNGNDVVNAVTSAGRALGDVAEGLGLTSEDDTAAASAAGDAEGRGKKKKAAKILLPLLLALKVKGAALVALALGAIALIAGKALLIGKIALLLAAIIGLKKLLSQQQKTVTYEIVAHPHHTSSHVSGHEYSAVGGGGGYGGGDIGGGYASSGSGGHGGWGRSLEDAHQIAYRAYAPQQAAQQ
ncbi:uncharacterized protein LOC124789773 [Schistocerca piceifrons]|uniref:uncharacterized protein LOC124789773 n=1 Tax=Schistocerca piceifrons TaxID=274613 RepID=UPI001F5E94AD|nr:uncharacterized protein LOC124789773 [Schistocerca piceifrons]